jgi:hypothetical protein
MADLIKSKYNPRLSMKANAEAMGISVHTLRAWLKQHNIDRHFDSMFAKYTAVKKLQKRNLSAEAIRQKTGYALMTVYKYMRMDSFEKKTEKDKLSSFDMSHSEIVIKSVSYDQQEILNNILKLHIPSGVYDCDMTYSKGNFWKNGGVPMPKLRFDKYPQVEGVLPLEDAEKIDDSSLNSIVIDPPFLILAPQWLRNSKVKARFDSFDTMEDAEKAYRYLLKLAWDKLKKKGILVFKTMDIRAENRNIWMSYNVQQWAQEIGFSLIDTFILISPSKILNRGMNQKVARKYHSYFFVFQKKGEEMNPHLI